MLRNLFHICQGHIDRQPYELSNQQNVSRLKKYLCFKRKEAIQTFSETGYLKYKLQYFDITLPGTGYLKDKLQYFDIVRCCRMQCYNCSSAGRSGGSVGVSVT